MILSLNRKIRFAASLEQTHASSGENSEVKLEIPGVRVNNSEVKLSLSRFINDTGRPIRVTSRLQIHRLPNQVIIYIDSQEYFICVEF